MQVLKSNASMLNVLYRFAARDGKLPHPLYRPPTNYQASHHSGTAYQLPSSVKEHTQPPVSASTHTSQIN